MSGSIRSFEEHPTRYQHLIEHSTDIIYWTDNLGQFTFFGPIAMQTFGYTREELLGRHYLDMVRPDRKHAVRRFYDLQWITRTSHSYLETPVITKDGSEIWLGQNAHLIETAGAPSGFQVIARNITRQTQEKEELERLVAERTLDLQAANEALKHEIATEEQRRQVQRLDSLGLLAGGIAHEFNNLLMIVSGYAEILRVGVPEAPKYMAYLDRVLGASRRGGELAQQMLDYAGKGKLEPELIDLSRLLNQSAATAKLNLDLADSLPKIEGDPLLIQQVALNLIQNAEEALDGIDGAIEIRTKVIEATPAFFSTTYFGEQLAPGKYISLEVTDNGCGMDAATQNRMFEPFFSTKFMGRGLGLTAVLGIVKSHHGALVVRSAIGQGTTVQVVFPTPILD